MSHFIIKHRNTVINSNITPLLNMTFLTILYTKDKAHVELSVKLVQRWILARLRNFTFYSIAELNKEIERLAPLYHDKVMKHLGKSRRELFVKLDYNEPKNQDH